MGFSLFHTGQGARFGQEPSPGQGNFNKEINILMRTKGAKRLQGLETPSPRFPTEALGVTDGGEQTNNII